MPSFGQVSMLLLVVSLMLCGSTKPSQLEIQAFQPAVVPIRAITTLTLKINVELNVTSHTSLQCRFKDISVPAKIEDGFIFCDTPPIKNTDRVSVHLDVDGKLYKTKRPLYFHEPFKVSNITPPVVSPAQNVHLTVSGFSCKDWIQYFVRFQTANGTKKSQQGICRDSIVSCYVPEFAANTRLRVGLTLSNRLVEWADTKILIQYPIDAIRSSVKDIKTDITQKGAFTFVVVLRDRFRNSVKLVIKTDTKKHARVSVQYSSQDKPQSLRFLECTTTVRSEEAGDEYVMSCAGAEKEDIFFYPSINNVPLGGQDRYEARTTLCPGRNSCEAEPKSFLLVIVLSCLGAVLLLSLVALFLFIRYQAAKKRRVAPKMTTVLEMEVQLPEDNDRTLVYRLENSSLDSSDEAEAITSPTHTGSSADSSELPMGVSAVDKKGDKQAEEQEQEGDLDEQMSGKSEKGDQQPNEEIEMRTQIQDLGHVSRLSAVEDFKEFLGSSPLPETEPSSGGETLAISAGSSNAKHTGPPSLTHGSNASFCGEQFLDKALKQATERRKSRLGNNRVLPTECDSVTLGQTKYTERFKNAAEYRQAWIANILGEDESHDNESEA